VSPLFHVNLAEIYAHAVASLDRLIAQVASHAPSAADFDGVRAALEALPLNTEEAGAARNRLDNVRRYLEAGEHGAARYELRLLARGLARIGEDASGDRTRFTPARGRPETGHSG
jgi:hypothetical protein